MKNKFSLSIALIFLILTKCYSQKDSISINFDVIFSADRIIPQTNRGIYLPTNIKDKRYSNPYWGLYFNEYTDIPQFHLSLFGGLLTTFSPKKGYDFHLDLIVEDRGQSFGALALNR